MIQTEANLRIFFQGNELVYIYVCVFLGFVPILCAGAAYGVVKLQNRRRRRLKIKQEELRNAAEGKFPVDAMMVHEWLHANHKRLVKVKFGPEVAMHVVGRKGEKLRTVDFRHVDTVTLEESLEVTSKKKPLVLVRVARDHDLVLELDSLGSRRKFVAKLETFLAANKKNLNVSQVGRFFAVNRSLESYCFFFFSPFKLLLFCMCVHNFGLKNLEIMLGCAF